jgi:hypothetical protein
MEYLRSDWDNAAEHVEYSVVGGTNMPILAVHFLFASRSRIHGLFISTLFVYERITIKYHRGVFGNYANITTRFSTSNTTARHWV